ncbi:putative secreted protein [Natranaerovirga pectinivora]|uniref:Putative secreted protein n=1 Tax=Natranaerovirga pectinivora TaxID=682400 RepID=A0A4V2UZR5_9FIRM|nr:DUF523 domain-containing protein [Natranaerovirga pectinivora]TCT12265.1 putative secreted protein [Natranaerovirga pectinivora]
MSKKQRRFVLLSHCLLNPHCRVHILGKNFYLPKKICSYFLEKNIAIIQLPCPEFMVMGYIRNPQGREQYNNVMFKTNCVNLINKDLLMVKELVENKHDLLAFLGVQGSPTCSVYWGKHKENKYHTESIIESDNTPLNYPKQLGILSEILAEELEKINIEIPFIEVPIREDLSSPKISDFWNEIDNIIIQ